jgi:hypothetical protein
VSEVRILLALAWIGCASCSKSSPPDSAPPAASGASSVSAVASAPSGQRGAPSGSAPTRGPSAERASFSGTYTAKVGAVEPPKNANEKTWVGDPGSVAVGKGAIDLVIGERGDAHGDAKGPLGEMTVTGTYDGKEMRASLIPKEPKSDSAMTGFMVLTAEGDALKGTLRASNRDAKLVREATVDLAKK